MLPRTEIPISGCSEEDRGYSLSKDNLSRKICCTHPSILCKRRAGSCVETKFKLGGGGARVLSGTFGYGKGTLKYYMDTIGLYIISNKKDTFHPFQNVHVPHTPLSFLPPESWVISTQSKNKQVAKLKA